MVAVIVKIFRGLQTDPELTCDSKQVNLQHGASTLELSFNGTQP